ncbi:MAG: elongation factor P [Candidatus Harrisonbacteria bacterium CG10_big_fil_rev_8_21_14_0_10_42_17]|uniref:Elongation factor P n=1 Tax=Candidatus Harrisonbacteria bacterium CG10_big_fil_rev_8_21_14_0_10_42_17 TaxID=1974584 RepID=A0A2M6WHY3_9BACT|nr:MAG: elongation factor P [Candidatus Harrisonbacteria bacterium CG10_big_fil_rev_8_21_14_0_10_42_17]
MLSYNELKKGVIFVLDGEPYEVLEYQFLRMQQRKPVAQTKIRNLMTGKVQMRNFASSDSFEEALITKSPIKYLYHHRGEYWFSSLDNPKDRFSMTVDKLGEKTQFLKDNSEVTAVTFEDIIISVQLPIKVDLFVAEAPPSERGNTAQGGTKQATLETGYVVSVPMFVSTGDVVRVNTETGEYVERAEKAS